MAEDALERGDGPIAAILEVAIRTLDERIAAEESMLTAGCADTIPTDGVRRSVRIHGRRTTIKLEPDFWNALDRIAETWHSSTDAVCSDVATMCGEGNLTSAIRVFTLRTVAAMDAPSR